MATCESLIKGAYLRAGVTRDIDEVRPRQMDRGLQVLQDVYLGLVGSGAFGRFKDVKVAADYTAYEQDRILVTTQDAVEITLPETTDDPDEGVRPPRDGSVIMVTDVYSADRSTYIYDANGALWTLIEGLALTSTAPLASRYRAGLEARLAVRLAEESGVAVTPLLLRQEAQGVSSLLHRFDAPETQTQASYF